jgi:hydroxymethylglutaryl-CoA lyase
VAERVRITDVSPRDGLQNEPGVIPTAEKVRLVELLCATGVDEVEVTSFVSPKWVPQLGDAREVFDGLNNGLFAHSPGTPYPAFPKTMFSALVPNAKGMEAVEAMAMSGSLLEKISVITAASETFSKKNTNATIAESIERIKEVVERSKHYRGSNSLLVRGYISCALACPFEGAIDPARVAAIAGHLMSIGVDELDLGDTIGAGTEVTTTALLKTVRAELGTRWGSLSKVSLHLHDTFGRAAECVRAGLKLGIRSFDGSVAGLGGCPYASTPGKRAPGNISTELLVQTIEQAGYTTGVNHTKLAEAARFAREIVAKSRAAAAAGEGT